jgi:hypothetical protein
MFRVCGNDGDGTCCTARIATDTRSATSRSECWAARAQHCRDGRFTIACLADNLDAIRRVEDHPKTGSNKGLVIGDHHANGRHADSSGSRACTAKAPSACGPASRCPPTWPTAPACRPGRGPGRLKLAGNRRRCSRGPAAARQRQKNCTHNRVYARGAYLSAFVSASWTTR